MQQSAGTKRTSTGAISARAGVETTSPRQGDTLPSRPEVSTVSRRSTKHGSVLDTILAKSDAPLSVPEIFARAKKIGSNMGIATVYRRVERWLETGAAVTVEIPGQPNRYEAAGKAHHHHFVCEDCGSVFDLPGCVKGIDGLLPPGFKAKKHDLSVFGTCSRCRQE